MQASHDLSKNFIELAFLVSYDRKGSRSYEIDIRHDIN